MIVDVDEHASADSPFYASRRTLAIDEDTVKLLRQHRAAQETSVGACEYVFADAAGHALRPSHATHQFKAAVRTSGLPPVRLHDLRHGAATLAQVPPEWT